MILDLAMPAPPGSHIERIVALEIKQTTVEGDLAEIRNDMKEAKLKVDAMHSVLMQAKGARWAILAVAGLAGTLASIMAEVAAAFWGKHG